MRSLYLMDTDRGGGVINKNDLKSVKTLTRNEWLLTSADVVEHHRRSRNSAENSPASVAGKGVKSQYVVTG